MADAVGQEIGEAEHQYHRRRKVGAGNARHDGECRHRAVDAAINPVAEVIASRPARQARPDRLFRMAMLQRVLHSLSLMLG